MSFSAADIGHLLLALGLLLGAAHACGQVFRRFGQPAVIGEILGGLLLGPTVFGAILPDQQRAVFIDHEPVAVALGAVYQLGLLLLMFCSGAEMRTVFDRGDRRTTLAITLSGTAVPLIAGLMIVRAFDKERLIGPAASDSAYAIVFGIAIAVTSIPVISRIFADLGILATRFSRIVLAAAVIEDIMLYVLLSAALAGVSAASGDAHGLVGLLGLQPDGYDGLALHALISTVFFVAALFVGPRLFGAFSGFRYNLLTRSSPIAGMLFFMFAATVVAVLLGVAPMFGAFVAGIAVGRSPDSAGDSPRESIKSFAYAFFIPVYFAIVGLRLNLLTEFDPAFFALFLLLACAIKALSVYAGARAVGESRNGATNFAVAMNARGGPGIVLASLALDAGIINERFYSSLVMLAIVTSFMAGSWLSRLVRLDRPLR